jgi:hypothetical protein
MKKKWLGRKGSNLRMTESKSVALPLGYAPTFFITRLGRKAQRGMAEVALKIPHLAL